MNKIIGILSGKGGVGKTTVCSNLASALRKSGEEVTVIDLDVTVSNLGVHFGKFDFSSDLQDYLQGRCSFDEIQHKVYGFNLIPSKISIDDTKYISYLDSNRLRKEMKKKQGVFILDFPPGLDEGVEKILNMVDEVYVVTTPDVPSVTDSIKTVSFVRKNKKPVSGLILNRVEKTKYEIPIDEIEMLCECPVVSILKEDSLIKKSIYQETPAHMINDINENSLIFEELAHKIVEKEYKRPSMIPLRRAFRFLRE